jgi:hypothetical protein
MCVFIFSKIKKKRMEIIATENILQIYAPKLKFLKLMQAN